MQRQAKTMLKARSSPTFEREHVRCAVAAKNAELAGRWPRQNVENLT